MGKSLLIEFDKFTKRVDIIYRHTSVFGDDQNPLDHRS